MNSVWVCIIRSTRGSRLKGAFKKRRHKAFHKQQKQQLTKARQCDLLGFGFFFVLSLSTMADPWNFFFWAHLLRFWSLSSHSSAFCSLCCVLIFLKPHTLLLRVRAVPAFSLCGCSCNRNPFVRDSLVSLCALLVCLALFLAWQMAISYLETISGLWIIPPGETEDFIFVQRGPAQPKPTALPLRGVEAAVHLVCPFFIF